MDNKLTEILNQLKNIDLDKITQIVNMLSSFKASSAPKQDETSDHETPAHEDKKEEATNFASGICALKRTDTYEY